MLHVRISRPRSPAGFRTREVAFEAWHVALARSAYQTRAVSTAEGAESVIERLVGGWPCRSVGQAKVLYLRTTVWAWPNSPRSTGGPTLLNSRVIAGEPSYRRQRHTLVQCLDGGRTSLSTNTPGSSKISVTG
jgi:hypothetical protein